MNDKTKTFDSYYGEDFDDIEYQAIGLRHINPKEWKGEAALYNSKWFDYRQMREVDATYLFAEYYRRAYRRMMCRREGIERGQYRKGFKGDDMFALHKGEVTGFWRARQKADELGIPYDVFCNYSMRWADSNLWKRLPRSNQLYSEKVLDFIKETWATELNSLTRLPESAFYTIQHYSHHSYQDAFQDWLCERLKTKANPEMGLANYISFNPMITKENALKHFSESMVKTAASYL